MNENSGIQVINSPTKSNVHDVPEVEKQSPTSSLEINPETSKHHKRHSGPYSTKIIAFLHELKEDVINEGQPNVQAADHIYHHPAIISPRSGLTEVYVEHNGRFTKTPKDVAGQCSNNSGPRYLQSVDTDDVYNTPLDMAIFCQKLWCTLTKICFGLLAGIAVYDMIVIHFLLENTKKWECIEKFLEMYSPISYFLTKCYHIVLTICLITLFDWFDMAHMSIQHLIDTIQYRKVWIVTLIYFVALLTALYNYSSDDLMILYDNIKEHVKNIEDIEYKIYWWTIAKKICCWSCLIGWISIILTNNEDLFLIQLMAMKKYDYDDDINQVYENVNAIS